MLHLPPPIQAASMDFADLCEMLKDNQGRVLSTPLPARDGFPQLEALHSIIGYAGMAVLVARGHWSCGHTPHAVLIVKEEAGLCIYDTAHWSHTPLTLGVHSLYPFSSLPNTDWFLISPFSHRTEHEAAMWFHGPNFTLPGIPREIGPYIPLNIAASPPPPQQHRWDGARTCNTKHADASGSRQSGGQNEAGHGDGEPHDSRRRVAAAPQTTE